MTDTTCYYLCDICENNWSKRQFPRAYARQVSDYVVCDGEGYPSTIKKRTNHDGCEQYMEEVPDEITK